MMNTIWCREAALVKRNRKPRLQRHSQLIFIEAHLGRLRIVCDWARMAKKVQRVSQRPPPLGPSLCLSFLFFLVCVILSKEHRQRYTLQQPLQGNHRL